MKNKIWKKIIAMLIITLLPKFTAAQTIEQIDSVTVKMCETLLQLKTGDAKEKVEFMVNKHLPDFFRLTNAASQQEADSISSRIFFRLQRNCTPFATLLNDVQGNSSDFQILKEKPTAKISDYDLNEFLKGGSFYYFEPDGTTVKVALYNNRWTETFQDGTKSKLVFRHKKDGIFILEFIESDNETRKNFSVKGDVYEYGIFGVSENSYDIWTSTKDNVIMSFKLYREKIN